MKKLMISSDTNETFKILKSLNTAKGIKEHQLFFIMGEKLIHEVLTELSDAKSSLKDRFELHSVITSSQHSDHLDAQKLALKISSQFPKARWTEFSTELFKQIDSLGTHSPLVVLHFKNLFTEELFLEPNGVEVVAPLSDPRNLGALARSSLAFQVQKIILTAESCHPYLPHSVKASSGAVLKISFSRSSQTLALMKAPNQAGSAHFESQYALDMDGLTVTKIKWPKQIRLWVGEEGKGLPQDNDFFLKLKKVSIPMNDLESLNATVSTSLVLWEIAKNRLIFSE